MTASPGPSPSPDTASMALRRMAAMLQITLDVLQADSRQELLFIIVNKTAAVARFDQATLWERGKSPRLLAVSGVAESNPHTAQAERLAYLVQDLPLQDEATVFDSGLPDSQAGDLLWLPLTTKSGPKYGLLLH